jgi:hypothetical protein
VRRWEGNARWLHLWKGEQCLCDIGRGHYDEALENGVLVVAVDRAMSDAAISQILNEVRGEEALSDAAFAVDDEVDLFVHRKVR